MSYKYTCSGVLTIPELFETYKEAFSRFESDVEALDYNGWTQKAGGQKESQGYVFAEFYHPAETYTVFLEIRQIGSEGSRSNIAFLEGAEYEAALAEIRERGSIKYQLVTGGRHAVLIEDTDMVSFLEKMKELTISLDSKWVRISSECGPVSWWPAGGWLKYYGRAKDE